MIRYGLKNFHSEQCKSDFVSAAIKKARDKQLAKAKRDYAGKQKTARAAHRADKDRVKPRAEWLDDLQTVVNRYVLHVIGAGEPCCTCGKPRRSVKFDAGHCFSRGARPELRFELTNIHPQCSVNCNQHGSGMRAEYKEFIRGKYGQEHLDWLECRANHPGLKEQFPHYEDIKSEIARYRKLFRSASK